MFGADVVVIEVSRFVVGEVDDSFRPGGEGHVLRLSGLTSGELLFDFGADFVESDS